MTVEIDRVSPLSFFNTILDTYEKAESAVGSFLERYYRIAEKTVCLRFAGPALLERIVPALEHLTAEKVYRPDLTVCLWDSLSTETAMPAPAWSREDYRERGEIHDFTDGRIHTFFQMDANALSLLDLERNLGLFWVRAAEQMPQYVTGSPLLSIFHAWFSRRSLQLVHAGAVGLPEGGVLIAGKSGAGKSTACLACLDSELFYASDDYSLISLNSVPAVYSLYSSGKKEVSDVKRLPFLVQKTGTPDSVDALKALYFLNKHYPEKIIRGFPLKAVLIPRIRGGRSARIYPASGAAALAALAPSTIFQLPGARENAFQFVARIARTVPSYYFDIGEDICEIPKTILHFLSA